MNVLFMDPYDGLILGKPFDPEWEPVRRNLGYTHRLAERLDLTAMTPHNELASSEYCLADPGKKYILYLPQGGDVRVNLSGYQGEFTVRWFNPATGDRVRDDSVKGGAECTLQSPFKESDAVLILRIVN